MAKDPAFLFYPGDYLQDTQSLNAESQVAYDRIMCFHMKNISIHMINITVSKKKVNFFIKGLDEDGKNDVMDLLTEVNDAYQIEWVALSISKRKAYTLSRGKNREGKTKYHMKSYENHMKPYVNHMDNDNDNEDIDVIKDINETVFNNMEGRIFNSSDVKAMYGKYCSERKKPLTIIVEEELLLNLKKFSNDNPAKALKIIKHSLVGQYPDFYELKDDKEKKPYEDPKIKFTPAPDPQTREEWEKEQKQNEESRDLGFKEAGKILKNLDHTKTETKPNK